MNICIYGAASRTIDDKYKTATEELGYLLAKRGHNLVFGGGDGGLMGAAARGFRRGNAGKIVGIAPRFFDVDGIIYEDCTEVIFTGSMYERKMRFIDISDAFITVPGGIGTFDEFFENITLRSLARHDKPMVLYNEFGYYDKFIDMLQYAEKENFVDFFGDKLYRSFTEPEPLIDYIENCSREYFDRIHFKAK